MRGVLVALALGLWSQAAVAQCTSAACPNPCLACRVMPASGANPAPSALRALFEQIAQGPNQYGTLGWDFGAAAKRSIPAGPEWCTPGTTNRQSVDTHFPCLLLEAIYYTESGWAQFCSGSNQTVISFDCGYGIAQVTSGMRPGETSAYDPDRVAGEAAYNVSVGAAILADKWRAVPCVGSHHPDVIEHWYFATWAYNGLAFKNNPNNPVYAADRVPYRTPGAGTTRGNYPYQEVVWGFATYPPSTSHWTGVALAYPVRSEICSACGSPTAAISEPLGSHVSQCPPVDGGAPDAGPGDGGESDDAGTDGGVVFPPAVIGGCGCGAARGSIAGLALLLLARAGRRLAKRSRPQALSRPTCP